MLKQSIGSNSLVLGLFALVTALLLTTTYLGTRDSIADAERAAAQKNLLEIFPPAEHDNDLLEDVIPIPAAALDSLGLRSAAAIHVARRDGVITGYIIPAIARDGYSGDIRMMVGIRSDGRIAGVRVVAHNETPGLGDKVELRKSDWILSFDGKSLDNPAPEDWSVAKDGGEFDQFTGATITPRAVVSQVSQVLTFFEEQRELLGESADTKPIASNATDTANRRPKP